MNLIIIYIFILTNNILLLQCTQQNQNDNEQFVILLNLFERKNSLIKLIKHYQITKNLASIYIIWSDFHDENYKYINNNNTKNNYVIKTTNSTSLNTRFFPIVNDPNVEAVFSLDDDIIVPNDALEKAFEIWKHNRDVLVGFSPRTYAIDQNGKYRYDWNFVSQFHKYSMILTNAAFFHKKYLYEYTYHLPRILYNFVEKNTNCEDIFMNILISNITKRSPIFFNKKFEIIKKSQKKAISNNKKHANIRSQCLEMASKEYGLNLKLINTTLYIDDLQKMEKIENQMINKKIINNDDGYVSEIRLSFYKKRFSEKAKFIHWIKINNLYF